MTVRVAGVTPMIFQDTKPAPVLFPTGARPQILPPVPGIPEIPIQKATEAAVTPKPKGVGIKSKARLFVQRAVRRKSERRPKAARRLSGPRTAVRRPPGKGRKRNGQLDLKALSKAWRKAGRPGRWIDFVKNGG